MDQTTDTANVVVRPPIALALAFIAGLLLDRFVLRLPFVPDAIPGGLIGGVLFLAGLALVIWALDTFRRAGTRVETHRPTTAIATDGPYQFSRNPIYTGMFLGLFGLAVAFDSLWILLGLALFAIIIRHGVVAREEAYLERRFGAEYLAYKSRVRRWI